MTQTVEFFFDCTSPYTYLAATQMEGLAQRTGAVVQWRPFLLGGAFQATGNRMPASVAAKGSYMLADLQLWARLYKVPFSFPKQFPIDSLLPQRVACALPQEQVAAAALAMMKAYWADGGDIQQAEGLRPILAALDLDADALLAAAQSDAVKAQLKANTEEAVTRGVFGAPAFFIGKTQFWGNDRLEMIEAVLSGKLEVA
tara:strand:- start:2127 stop:2726 length:600 start_codon:yes stop_codon:yes gene_type:complete